MQRYIQHETFVAIIHSMGSPQLITCFVKHIIVVSQHLKVSSIHHHAIIENLAWNIDKQEVYLYHVQTRQKTVNLCKHETEIIKNAQMKYLNWRNVIIDHENILIHTGTICLYCKQQQTKFHHWFLWPWKYARWHYNHLLYYYSYRPDLAFSANAKAWRSSCKIHIGYIGYLPHENMVLDTKITFLSFIVTEMCLILHFFEWKIWIEIVTVTIDHRNTDITIHNITISLPIIV